MQKQLSIRKGHFLLRMKLQMQREGMRGFVHVGISKPHGDFLKKKSKNNFVYYWNWENLNFYSFYLLYTHWYSCTPICNFYLFFFINGSHRHVFHIPNTLDTPKYLVLYGAILNLQEKGDSWIIGTFTDGDAYRSCLEQLWFPTISQKDPSLFPSSPSSVISLGRLHASAWYLVLG